MMYNAGSELNVPFTVVAFGSSHPNRLSKHTVHLVNLLCNVVWMEVKMLMIFTTPRGAAKVPEATLILQ